MASLLHVKATAREDSYSLKAAEAFLESYTEAHPADEIVTVDLATDDIPEFGPSASRGKYLILSGQTPDDQSGDAWKAVESTIENFKKADKVVISAPMWNFGIPYRLKQYIDVIVQPGYTFSFSPETGYSGLVTDKPALLILARGGEYAPGSEAAALDFQRPYLEWILKFIGFEDIGTVVIEPTLQGGPDVAGKKLEEAVKSLKEKAREF